MIIIILDSKDYISVREAANKYNYSLKGIRYLIKRHRVKAFKHARKWWVYEPSLKRWIKNNY